MTHKDDERMDKDDARMWTLYVNHVEDLLMEAEMAVRYEVKDKEAYYERLRKLGREILDDIRTTFATLRADHAKELEELYEALTLQLYGMNLNITMAEQKNMFKELEYVYKKLTPPELLSKTD